MATDMGNIFPGPAKGPTECPARSASDNPDIAGHCETCQAAFHITYHVFYKITGGVTTLDIIKHNLDIQIQHTHEETNNGLHCWKHNYKVFSPKEATYLLWGGIQIDTPIGPHKELCPDLLVKIFLPIRKGAAYDLKMHGERLIQEVILATMVIALNS